jgi:hypothetical protein
MERRETEEVLEDILSELRRIGDILEAIVNPPTPVEPQVKRVLLLFGAQAQKST